MNKLQATLSAASLILVLAASTLPAPAAQILASGDTCPVQDAEARPLTNLPAELPDSIIPYAQTGTAMVQIDLSETGAPVNAAVVKSSGDLQLDRAAVKAALAQQYTPQIKDCIAVAGSYLYEVDFQE